MGVLRANHLDRIHWLAVRHRREGATLHRGALVGSSHIDELFKPSLLIFEQEPRELSSIKRLAQTETAVDSQPVNTVYLLKISGRLLPAVPEDELSRVGAANYEIRVEPHHGSCSDWFIAVEPELGAGLLWVLEVPDESAAGGRLRGASGRCGRGDFPKSIRVDGGISGQQEFGEGSRPV